MIVSRLHGHIVMLVRFGQQAAPGEVSMIDDRTLILPADIVIAPLAGIAHSACEAQAGEAGHWVVTRSVARTRSQIVDADSAALLRQFQEPKMVAQAIAEFCRERGRRPSEVASRASAVLQRFCSAGLLLEARSQRPTNLD